MQEGTLLISTKRQFSQAVYDECVFESNFIMETTKGILFALTLEL